MTDDPVLLALQRAVDAAPARGRAGGDAERTEPAFAAEGELALQALAVSIDGIGEVAQGLSDGQAQALHAISRPAPYGQGERTLLDPRVRHSGEIDADRVHLRWTGDALAALQRDAAAALGLAGLRARLHKLLVYGPGQFFKPHQDTEKQAGMVGTLVLVWPSAHIGGELRVCQGDAERLFASQQLTARALRWFAFYADCRHEVQTVQEGWRVVLTFDLLLADDGASTPAPADPALVRALRDLFDGGAAPRREPWLLLLDHEYTEHGLRWPLLKGKDREHVAALRAAAQAAGLVPQLALAQIHQNWTASVAYGGRGHRDTGKPEPDELIDEEMTLDFWVSADGQARKGQPLQVSLDDCASFSDDLDRFLVDEEYEGYMGNYGETLDYWYRRAALVLQSPLAAEAARFATEPEAALADAVELAQHAERHAALAQRLQLALADLQDHVRHAGRAAWPRLARLAAVVPPALATELCAPFEWQQFGPADAAPLAAVAQARGQDWLLGLLRAWGQGAARRAAWGRLPPAFEAQGRPADELARLWPTPLGGFIGAGKAAGLGEPALVEICALAIGLLRQADRVPATPAQELATAARRIQAVGDLAEAIQALPGAGPATSLLADLLGHVAALPRSYPPRRLVPLVQALSGPLALALPGRRALRDAVRGALEAALRQDPPAADDHGLREIEWTCRCADCQPAIAWAESPALQPLQLALGEARRSHVQQALQDAAAPLTFDVLKRGSPYKLVLTKSPELHAVQRRRREEWAAALDALDATAGGLR